MKKVITFVVFSAILVSLSAQEGWYFQTPANIKKIAFIDNNTLIAVGSGIWKSDDFGESWKGTALGYKFRDGSVNHFLNSVDFFATSVGFAVGDRGLIMKTVNGGNNWERKYGPPFDPFVTSFTDVQMLSSNVIVVIGLTKNGTIDESVIIKSTDGGDNWTTIKVDPGSYYNDLDFVDENSGWITANNKRALKTTDGGNTWISFALPSTIGYNYSYSLDFIDANNGLISTSLARQVVKTTDGGSTWRVIDISIGGSSFSPSLVYFSTGTAYMLKTGGGLMKSVDHGENWSDVSTVPDGYGDRIVFDSPSKGVAFNTGSNVINHTTNGGQQWDRKEWDPKSIFSFDQSHSWAGNDDYINRSRCLLKTTDGQKWQMISIQSDIPNIIGLNNFDFKTTTTGYAIANHQLSPTNFTISLVKTTDGGLYWKKLYTSIALEDHYMLNDQFGWIVLSNGSIYKTLDGGVTWGNQTSFTSNLLASVQFIDENYGFACGWGGNFLRTTNGGLLWNRSVVTGYDGADLNGLKFFDSQIGYMVGKQNFNSFVLKTADGGLTWTNITPPNLNWMLYGNSFQVKGPSELYVMSSEGILKSNDAGASWQKIQQISQTATNQFSVLNSQRIYLSDVGGILYTENGGITDIEEEVPSFTPGSFTVSQNYPNPFNPETVFNLYLPESGYVRGSVFDIKGSEVAKIIDGEISAGSHRIRFNGASLPSGVYFLRVDSAFGTKSIKILLLK
ncbi:MAG: hypothetical protein AMXMBFR49_23730 [Chlorobiota bacterium]|nr:MAG: T9SS C-terminal target domain-containing protein [Chlorobiota bacterium]